MFFTRTAPTTPRRALAMTAAVVMATATTAAIPPLTAEAAVVNCAPGKPVVTSVAINKSRVDVTKAAGTITFTVKATDSTQPLTFMSVDTTSPAKSKVTRSRTVYMSLASGTAKKGTWRGVLTVPRYDIGGTWKITQVTLGDGGRGYASYHAYDSDGFPTYAKWGRSWTKSFKVTSPTADVTAPTLSKLSFSKTSINTTSKAVKVTIKATLHDNLSGVVSAYAYATPPGAGSSEYFGLVVKGTGATRTASGSATVPRWLGPKGTWSLQFGVSDRVDNRRTYSTAALKAKHLPSKLTITSGTDATKPKLSSFSASPTKIDIRTSAKKVSFSAVLTDTKSGVNYAYVDITGADGFTSTSAYLGRVSATSSTFKGSITVQPCALPSGTATLSVIIYDRAGNGTEVTNDQLHARKFRSTLGVTAS